jgi:hypothetical protein
MKKMNPKLKQKWVTALRSGDYKQGKGKLCSLANNGIERFCCLGVLCDVAGVKREPRPDLGFVRYEREATYLPLEFSVDPALWEAQSYLIRLNDKGVSFSEIADYIEEKL